MPLASKDIGLVIAIIFLALLPSDPRFMASCAALAFLIIRRPPAAIRSMILVSPLLLVIALSIAMTTGSAIDYSAAAKGLWYLGRPIVYIMVGYHLALEARSPRLIIVAFIIAGLIASLDYIIKFATDPNVIGASRTYVRRMIGKGSILSSLSLMLTALILLRLIKGTRVGPIFAFAVAAVSLVAIVVSQSRSGLIVALTAIPFIYIIFRGPLFPVLVATLGASLFVVTTPLLAEFLGPNSLSRMAATWPDFLNEMIAIDRNGKAEVAAYWRGYESFLAYSQMRSSGAIRFVFGGGLSEEVRLPFEMVLGTEGFMSIPMFHSGYSLLIVRGGILAVTLMVIQLAILAARCSRLASTPGLNGTFGLMCMGILITTTLNTSVNAGIYNSGGTPALILGLAAGLLAVVQSDLNRPSQRHNVQPI